MGRLLCDILLVVEATVLFMAALLLIAGEREATVVPDLTIGFMAVCTLGAGLPIEALP